MKTVTGNELGAQPALCDDLTAPTPGANEVPPRGLAPSVNPADDGIAAGIATGTWFRTNSRYSQAHSPRPPRCWPVNDAGDRST